MGMISLHTRAQEEEDLHKALMRQESSSLCNLKFNEGKGDGASVQWEKEHRGEIDHKFHKINQLNYKATILLTDSTMQRKMAGNMRSTPQHTHKNLMRYSRN